MSHKPSARPPCRDGSEQRAIDIRGGRKPAPNLSRDTLLCGQEHAPRPTDLWSETASHFVARIHSRRYLRSDKPQLFQQASAPQTPISSHADSQPNSALISGLGNSIGISVGTLLRTSIHDSTHHSAATSINHSTGTSLVRSIDKSLHTSDLDSTCTSTGN